MGEDAVHGIEVHAEHAACEGDAVDHGFIAGPCVE